MNRRSFLRGSTLAAVALVCADVAAPADAFGQAQQSDGPQDKKQKDRADGQSEHRKEDGKEQDGKEGEKKNADKEDSAATDPYKVTRIDENGREYRMCPVCGSNMYRQDHTWTCENCGYTYEE